MEPICPKCGKETTFLMYNKDEGGETHMCVSCDWVGTIFPESSIDDDNYYFDNESIDNWRDF